MARQRLTAVHRPRLPVLADPKTGTQVRVPFGRRESVGTVLGRTVTGRYNVEVDVEGADDPVSTTYAPEDVHPL